MTIRHLTREEVSVHVAARPERVYELVSDITRMGEWSPECYRCQWTDGATGPAVGARFKARNRHRLLRWSNTPTVTVARPGQEFAFSRSGPGAGEVVWRYRVQDDGDGTRLTESYEAVRRASPIVIWLTLRLMGIRDREADLRVAMTSTLERIKATAESELE